MDESNNSVAGNEVDPFLADVGEELTDLPVEREELQICSGISGSVEQHNMERAPLFATSEPEGVEKLGDGTPNADSDWPDHGEMWAEEPDIGEASCDAPPNAEWDWPDKGQKWP